MSTTASITGTSHDLLALQHRGRSSASPAKQADTGIGASNSRGHGSSFAIALDSTGNVIASEDKSKNHTAVGSAAVKLFG